MRKRDILYCYGENDELLCTAVHSCCHPEGICRDKCKYNDCVAEVSAAIELLLRRTLVRLGSICSCFYWRKSLTCTYPLLVLK
jgi:hypothetical protein